MIGRNADLLDVLWMPSGAAGALGATVVALALLLLLVPALFPIPTSFRLRRRTARTHRGWAGALPFLGPFLILSGFGLLAVRPNPPLVLVLSSRSRAIPETGAPFATATGVEFEGFKLIDVGPVVDQALERSRRRDDGFELEEWVLESVLLALSDPDALTREIASIDEATFQPSPTRRDVTEATELAVLRCAAQLGNVAGIVVEVEPRAGDGGATWGADARRYLTMTGTRFRPTFVHFESVAGRTGTALLGVVEPLAYRDGRWETKVLIRGDREGNSPTLVLREEGADAGVSVGPVRGAPGVSLVPLEFPETVVAGKRYELGPASGPFLSLGTAREPRVSEDLVLIDRRSADLSSDWNGACEALNRELKDPELQKYLRERIGFVPRSVQLGAVPPEGAPVVVIADHGCWVCRASEVDALPELVPLEGGSFRSPSQIYIAQNLGGGRLGALGWAGIELEMLSTENVGPEFFTPSQSKVVPVVELRALMEGLSKFHYIRPGSRVVPIVNRIALGGGVATFIAIDPFDFDFGFHRGDGLPGPFGGEKWWVYWATLFEAAAASDLGGTWSADGSMLASVDAELVPRYLVKGSTLDEQRAGAVRGSSLFILLGLAAYAATLAAPLLASRKRE